MTARFKTFFMTKKSLLTLFLTSIGLMVISQNFISSEKQWNVKFVGFSNPVNTEIYFIDGTTSFNNYEYQIIWVSYDSLNSRTYQGLLREEEDKVFYVPPNSTEGLLYDFGLQAGDSVYVRNMFCGDLDVPLSVFNVDTVEYYGVSRKRWFLSQYGYVNDVWLEGIGSLFGPIHTAYSYCIACPVWDLLCYHESGELFYRMPYAESCFEPTVSLDEKTNEKATITPNPVNRGQPFRIVLKKNAEQVSIFNASGVPVETFDVAGRDHLEIKTASYPAGLYLVKILSFGNRAGTYKVMVE